MARHLDTLVLDSLPGAVIAVDLDDRVTAWNSAAEAMFGWSAAEAMGAPPPNVPDDAWPLCRRWMAQAAAGRAVEATTQWARRDGRRIDVTIELKPVRDGDRVVGYAALCRDGSSTLQLQRRGEELLLVRRLSSLVQRLLQDLDLGSVLQAIVEVAVEVVGVDSGVISLEQAPGVFARMANVNIPEELAHHEVIRGEGIHGRVIVSGEPLLVEDYDAWSGGVAVFRGRGFHGTIGVPIRGEGRVIGAFSVHTSDPERLLGHSEVGVLELLAQYAAVAIANATAYRRVSSERERFLALVDAIPDGLAVVEGGVVTAWNSAASRLTGCDQTRVIGRPAPIDLEAAAEGMELPATNGTSRWLQTVRSDLPHGDGHLYLLRDITEQRTLDRAKDLFFATTSHELKTPLTVVKGLASTLHQHWERMTDAQRSNALETIERRAASLDRLVERILVGSRVQAGAFQPVPTPVDLRPVIEDMIGGFAAATGPQHHVWADLPEQLPLVGADRQALDTILGHLVENAIKYSPDGGEVTVAVRSVQAEGAAGLIEVAVRDRGVGVGTDIEPLLAAFVQGDGKATRRFGGVGLGLYIVDQLVTAQGGSLTASSREGGGSCFAFTLPLWT